MPALTVFSTFVVADFLFLAGGALLLGFALIEDADMGEAMSKSNIVRNLLFTYSPATAAIVNAGLVFFAFVVSIPGLILPSTRGWLRFLAVLVVMSAFFTMIIGLDIWGHTLKTRSEFSTIYATLPPSSQDLIQTQFNCCGYENSTSPPFVPSTVCSSPTVAASKGGCVSSFTSEINLVLDQIFTSAFAIVGVDAALFLAILMLLQDRKEKERYRHIDEKTGVSGF